MFRDLPGGPETVYLRLGLEPMCWDSNLSKTQLGILTPGAWAQTQPKLNSVFQLRSQTWFQDLMKLWFLMFHCRKNSVRDKGIDKTWFYLKRNKFHRPLRRWVWPRNVVWLAFMSWVISQANEWEDYSNHLGKGEDVQELDHPRVFGLWWSFWPWNCHSTSGCVM